MSTVTSLVLSGKRKIIKQRPAANQESSSAKKQAEAQPHSANPNDSSAAQTASQHQDK